MPNFNFYPGSEEDQAYLAQLNRGTDIGLGQTERQADRDSESTRRQGQTIGSMLENAPSDYMEGARFRSQQDTEEQSRNLRQSEENRTQQLFPSQLKGADLRNDLLGADLSYRNEDVTQNQSKTEQIAHQKQLSRGAVTPGMAEESHVQFRPGMTREEMELAQGYAQGGANIGSTQAATRASNQSTAVSSYDLASHKAADELAGLGVGSPTTPVSAPTAPTGIQGLDLSSVGQQPQGGMDLRGGGSIIQAAAPAQASAATPVQAQAPRLKDEDAARIAKQYNLTPQQVQGAYARQAAAKQEAARNFTTQKETQAAITPDIAHAREEAGKLSASIGNTATLMERNVAGYSAAAGKGGNGVMGTIAKTLGIKNAPGMQNGLIESGQQSRYRHEVADQLRSAGLDAEANNVESAGLTAVPARMQEGLIAAMQKQIGDLRTLQQSNPSIADDRKIQDAIQSANFAIKKFQGMLSGRAAPPNLINGHVSDQIMRGVSGQ